MAIKQILINGHQFSQKKKLEKGMEWRRDFHFQKEFFNNGK